MMKFLVQIIAILSCCNIFAQDYSITKIPEDLLKNADAVIRNYEYQVVINSIDDVDTHYTKVITILNKAGEKYAYVRIPYDKTTKVSGIKVRTFDVFGKLSKTYSKSDFVDMSYSEGFELYTESRILALKILSSNYPFTIELNYDEDSSDTAFLNSLVTFYDYNVSIQHSAIRYTNNSGINLRHKIKESKYSTLNFQGDKTNFAVSLENLPAFVEEKYAPSPETVMPKAEFALDSFMLKGKKGDLTSWQNYGTWFYNDILDPVSQITPEIQQEVNALKLTGSTEDKVKTIYQYMQNKTRYVFVALGIGGWQPMVADDVRKKGYGDCKALTNYMRVLLKAAGINANYCEIYMDSTPKGYDKDFPKFGGNHIVLYVPTEDGKSIWLENTSQKIAFNHLGYKTLDRNVVMIGKDKTEIVETPKSIAENNKEIIRTKAKILDDNTLEVTSKFSYQGNSYDMMMAMLYLTPTEQKDAFKHRYDNLQFSVLDIQNLNNDRSNADLSFDFNFKADNYAKSLGNDRYFRAIPFLDSDFYVEEPQRKFPIEIPFGFTDDYEIEYTIPAEYKVAELPMPAKIDSEFGTYSIEFVNSDKSLLLLKRKFVLKKGIFPPEKANDYIKFRKQISKIDNTKLLLTKR